MNRIWWYLASTMALVSASSGLAIAGEPIEIEAGDEVVTVIARGVHAAGTLHARGDRIELELDAATRGRAELDDETIKRAELLSDPPRLSIALHHSKRSTELTAANARVEIRNGGVVVTLPRNPHRRLSRASDSDHAEQLKPAKAAKPEAETVAAAPVARPVAAPVPAPAPVPVPVPVPVAHAAPKAIEPPAPIAAPVAKHPVPVAAPKPAKPAEPAIEQPAVEAAVAPVAPVAPVAAVAAEPIGVPDPGRNPIWITVGILGASVVLLFWLQRRKQKTVVNNVDDPLRLIAQRPLSPKSKMVLFETHGREILVAIGDGRPVLLGKWKVERRVTEIDADHEDGGESLAELETMRAPAPVRAVPRRTTPSSPSVAGILKLRGPQAQVRPPARPAIDESQEDLDAEWAQELMQATSKRRTS